MLRTIFIITLITLPIFTADAETIHLRDGNVVTGTIQHAYAGIFQLVLASGDTIVVGRDEISRIEFTPNTPSSPAPVTKAPAGPAREAKSDAKGPYSTPNATFDTWRQALLKGDVNTMASCFARASGALMRTKLDALPKAERKRMMRDAAKTQFDVPEAKIEGDRAELTVGRTQEGRTEMDIINFVNESGLWKMLPKE